MKENFKKESPLLGLEGSGGGLSFFGGATSDPVYVDDVFSTFLYEGTGSTITVNNGIDLSGEGGLVWVKRRTSSIGNNILVDTERGASKWLRSNSNGDELTAAGTVTAFSSNGFTLGNYSEINGSGDTGVTWSFRKSPGFFDVVKWTGNGTQGRQIAHSLGSTPGMIFVKRVDGDANWEVWHNTFGVNEYMTLNSDAIKYTSGGPWNGTAPTSTHFTIDSTGGDSDVNYSGDTYVAYVFGHNDASFGTDSDEAIIKCGSYTGGGSTSVEVNLGFEPQWLLIKRATGSATGWCLYDNMRGVADYNQGDMQLLADEYAVETNENRVDFYPQGFRLENDAAHTNASGQTYIYMAIRRPHKPPTAGTDVFAVDTFTGSTPNYISNFAVDFVISREGINNAGNDQYVGSRLQGPSFLKSNSSGSQLGASAAKFDYMNGWGSDSGSASSDKYAWMFKRAPGCFDVVAYTGTGSAHNINHNLTVNPELIIVKNRTTSGTGWSIWSKYLQADGASPKMLRLDTYGIAGTSNSFRDNSHYTSTVFGVGNYDYTNDSGDDYIAYLFASLDSISKVGTYTGTGSNVNVDCGFTSGARFIMIKRTDTEVTSGVPTYAYIWDTVRGIVSGNDPYLALSTDAAQVTNTDYIDPLNSGFTVTSSAPAALNASGGTYLFLAIA